MKTNDSTYYYKYVSDSYEVIKGIFYDKKIRFTQPWAFNDPLEFNPMFNFTVDSINAYVGYKINGYPMYSLEEFTRMLLKELRINEAGIFSLTSNKDSFAMWNIYANGHKGFLLEFYPNFNEHPVLRPIDKSEFYIVKPVKYVSKNYVNINEIIRSDNLKSLYVSLNVSSSLLTL